MTLVQSYQPVADPAFGRASHIDLFLGIGDVYRAYQEGKDVSADCSIRMDNTLFGWTVSGQIQDSSSRDTILRISVTPMDALLEKLREKEQPPEEVVLNTILTIMRGMTQADTQSVCPGTIRLQS